MNFPPAATRFRAVSVEFAAYLDARNVEMHVFTDTGKTITVVFPRDSIFALQKHIVQIGEDCPEIASWNDAPP